MNFTKTKPKKPEQRKVETPTGGGIGEDILGTALLGGAGAGAIGLAPRIARGGWGALTGIGNWIARGWKPGYGQPVEQAVEDIVSNAPQLQESGRMTPVGKMSPGTGRLAKAVAEARVGFEPRGFEDVVEGTATKVKRTIPKITQLGTKGAALSTMLNKAFIPLLMGLQTYGKVRGGEKFLPALKETMLGNIGIDMNEIRENTELQKYLIEQMIKRNRQRTVTKPE